MQRNYLAYDDWHHWYFIYVLHSLWFEAYNNQHFFRLCWTIVQVAGGVLTIDGTWKSYTYALKVLIAEGTPYIGQIFKSWEYLPKMFSVGKIGMLFLSLHWAKSLPKKITDYCFCLSWTIWVSVSRLKIHHCFKGCKRYACVMLVFYTVKILDIFGVKCWSQLVHHYFVVVKTQLVH